MRRHLLDYWLMIKHPILCFLGKHNFRGWGEKIPPDRIRGGVYSQIHRCERCELVRIFAVNPDDDKGVILRELKSMAPTPPPAVIEQVVAPVKPVPAPIVRVEEEIV